MNKFIIKRIIETLYNFEMTKGNRDNLVDGGEILTTHQDEFKSSFRYYDPSRGIIVTPEGYVSGLVYRSANHGEFYNHPEWMPDLVKFKLNILGLKAGSFYKVSLKARNAGGYKLITNDRSIKVLTSDRDLLLSEDFTNDKIDKVVSGVFRSTSNEIDLAFTLGKVHISDIIIEEVEVLLEENDIRDTRAVTKSYGSGKKMVASFGVFESAPLVDKESGRYVLLRKFAGDGINLYYDVLNAEYTIERDNNDDIIGEPFTNTRYMVDINLNKVPNNGQFAGYDITKISPDTSSNTLKQGYMTFKLVDHKGAKLDSPVKDGRIYIVIHKFN